MATESEGAWVRRPCAEEVVVRLIRELGVSAWSARILAGRGVTDPESAQAILHPGEQPLHDPILLPGIDPFLTRIERAIKNGERVVVHGDYDADGVTSAAIMQFALRRVGLAPDVFLPNRFDSGYGIHPEWVETKRGEGYHLIVTTDCGSSALEAADKAREIGIDLIVTDHHTPNPDLPVAAHVNPHLPDSQYPFKHLSGAGVAFKLAQALSVFVPPSFQSRYRKEIPIELAMIGAVADVMPLLDENRRIVVEGLERLRTTPSPGLRALLEMARCSPAGVNVETIGFQVAPRLNAAGRLESPQIAFDLLAAEDPDLAAGIASELDRINERRKKLVQKVTEEALARVRQQTQTDCVVLMDKGWHRGVVGISAAKVVEETGLPVFLGALGAGRIHGSCRAPAGYHLAEILAHAESFTEHGGGHAAAGGFTVLEENWRAFSEAVTEGVRLAERDVEIPVVEVDGFLDSDRGFSHLMAEVSSLEPFGPGFPVPVFGLCRWSPANGVNVFGSNHLKLQIDPFEGPLEAVGFGMGDRARDLKQGPVDVLLQYGENHWNGETTLRPMILGLRPPLRERVEAYRPQSVCRIEGENGAPLCTVWDGRGQGPLGAGEPLRVGYGPDWLDWWQTVLPGRNPSWKSRLWEHYRALPGGDWPGENAVGYGGDLPDLTDIEVIEILWPPLRKADREWLRDLLKACPENPVLRLAYSEADLEKWCSVLEAEISRQTLGTVYRGVTERTTLKKLFTLSMPPANIAVCLEVLSELELVEWVGEEVSPAPNPAKKDFESAKTIEEWNDFVDSIEAWRAQSLNGSAKDLVVRWLR